MILAAVWTNPIIVGLTVGLPATVFGVIGFRRAAALDEAAVESAQIAAQGDQVKVVIDGLDRIIANLRTDNAEVRQLSAELTLQLRECRSRVAELRRAAAADE